MKKVLLCSVVLMISLSSRAQKLIVEYHPLYPIHEIKESYDDNLNLVYNLKLVNRSKQDITHIVFRLEPTWLNGDTQLMTALRADKTIDMKKSIALKAGQTIYYNLETPSNKYSVSAQLVRYADGSIKKY